MGIIQTIKKWFFEDNGLWPKYRGGYQEVTPDLPPDRLITEDEWGTAVPKR